MRSVLMSVCLFTLLITLVLGSCQPDESYTKPPAITGSGITQKVPASLTGRIVDENNNPVNGATIKAGNSITLTDINGTFVLQNATLEKNAGYIIVEKHGYFPGSRTIIVNEKTTNHITIQLIPKTYAGTFTASGGGSISVPTGGTINFPSNSIVNATTNSAYTGAVSVAAFTFDPSATNFSEIMPGALRGITTANTESGLRSYSMMAVELKGAGGEKLQLATGKTATITFPIPASLQASAPQTIPLWYFDEVKGLWKEEGSAVKQGSNYVGTVSHFSFWNCDAPFALVNFQAIFKDQSGNALQKQKVAIMINANEVSSFGYTDTEGKIAGLIPANQSLQLNVISSCNTAVYNQTITTTNSNVNLGTVTVNNPGLVNITVSGTVKNCTNTAIANGFVSLKVGGNNFRANVINGSFSTTVFSCTNINVIEAYAYDNATSQHGDTVFVNVTGNSSTTIPLIACGNTASQFINYTLGTSPYTFAVPGDSITYDRASGLTKISATTNNFSKSLTLALNTVDTIPGMYSVNYLYVNQGPNQMYMNQAAMNVTISQYGPKNGFIIGNFSGNVRDSSNSTILPINCNFKIKRTN